MEGIVGLTNKGQQSSLQIEKTRDNTLTLSWRQILFVSYFKDVSVIEWEKRHARIPPSLRELLVRWKCKIRRIIKNWIIGWYNSRVLIGLAIMLYEPFIQCSPNMVTVRVCSKLKTTWKSVVFAKKVGKNSRYFVGVSNKTIIPLVLVGYEMIIVRSALRASLAIYNFVSKAHSWNNSQVES